MVMGYCRGGSERVRIVPDRDGWISCPVCRRNRRLLKITAQTRAEALPVWCRDCKNEIILDITRSDR